MDWVKLEQGNDWGTLFLHMPGNRNRFVWPQKGEMVSTRFPNGDLVFVKIVLVDRTETVSDHGKTDHVHNKYPMAEVDFHGLPLLIDLTAIQVGADWANSRKGK